MPGDDSEYSPLNEIKPLAPRGVMRMLKHTAIVMQLNLLRHGWWQEDEVLPLPDSNLDRVSFWKTKPNTRDPGERAHGLFWFDGMWHRFDQGRWIGSWKEKPA